MLISRLYLWGGVFPELLHMAETWELGNSGSTLHQQPYPNFSLKIKRVKECHNPRSFVDFFPENDEKDIYSHDFSPKMMKKIFILTIFIVLHP